MVYGIISNLDNVNTLEVFKSKRIEEEYLVHINYLGELIEVLKEPTGTYQSGFKTTLIRPQWLSNGFQWLYRKKCANSIDKNVIKIYNIE